MESKKDIPEKHIVLYLNDAVAKAIENFTKQYERKIRWAAYSLMQALCQIIVISIFKKTTFRAKRPAIV